METLIVMLAFVLAAIIAIVILSLRKGKGKIREPIIKEIAEREEELPHLSLDKIKGIGPRYKQKLMEAGVQHIQDLLTYENRLDILAKKTTIPRKRIINWIEQAKNISHKID